jgi:hypothetical protein
MPLFLQAVRRKLSVSSAIWPVRTRKTRNKDLLWCALGFIHSILTLSMEVPGGNKILHCRVGTEVPKMPLLAVNCIMTFICQPRTENETWSGQEQNAHEMIHHGVCRGEFSVPKSNHMRENYLVSMSDKPVQMSVRTDLHRIFLEVQSPRRVNKARKWNMRLVNSAQGTGVIGDKHLLWLVTDWVDLNVLGHL